MPDPVRELAMLLRSPEPAELRAFIEREGSGLGVRPWLQGSSDDELVDGLRDWIARQRKSARERRAEDKRQRALDAARRLIGTARWNADDVHLDPSLLLGEVIADGERPFLQFVVDDSDVYVDRSRLLQVRKALKPMTGVRCWVERSALHFRWDGDGHHGGLRLYHPPERNGVLRMEFSRPEPVFVPPLRRRPPPRPNLGAWLGDIIADLGFP